MKMSQFNFLLQCYQRNLPPEMISLKLPPINFVIFLKTILSNTGVLYPRRYHWHL